MIVFYLYDDIEMRSQLYFYSNVKVKSTTHHSQT